MTNVVPKKSKTSHQHEWVNDDPSHAKQIWSDTDIYDYQFCVARGCRSYRKILRTPPDIGIHVTDEVKVDEAFG